MSGILSTLPIEAIFDSMGDGVIVVDDANNVLHVNRSAQRLLVSQPPYEQSLTTLLADHPQVKDAYDHLNSFDDKVERRDEAALGNHRREQFIEVRLDDLLDQDGRKVGQLIFLQDVTTHKHAQTAAAWRMAQLTALRHVDARINSSLEIDDVLVMALKSARDMTSADAGFISLLAEDGNQQRLVEVTGRYKELGYEGNYKTDYGVVGRVIRTGRAELVRNVKSDPDYNEDLPETQMQMAIPLVVHDRLIGILNLETAMPGNFHDDSFTFVKMMAGRIATAVENARLYTRSREQLAELRTLYEQLSELEQIKTDMIRIASHDLKNPLGTVMGYLDLLEMDAANLKPEHHEFIQTMTRLTEKMQNIIDDILTLERLSDEANAQQAFDLRTLVQRSVELQRPHAGERTLHLKLDNVPQVRGDFAQMREAVDNLVENAIKYTMEAGTIEIILRSDVDSVIFEVKDDGYGIPENMQARLFEPFFRAVSEETRYIDGTGLGLSLVRNIVRRHAGEIIFSSTHGEGSTFGFKLPPANEKEIHTRNPYTTL